MSVTRETLSSGLLKPVLFLTAFLLDFFAAAAVDSSHHEFIRLDVQTPARRRYGIRVIYRRRARLKDERPQLSKVLTPIVKIGKAVPAEDSFADPIPSPGQSSAKAGSEPGAVPACVMAIPCCGNFVRQIPLGPLASDRVMAADEIERADGGSG